MLKTVGIVFAAFLIIIVCINPVKNYMSNMFYKDMGKLKEAEVIGSVYDYNPYIKEAQEILKDAGFDPGPINGLMNRETRVAIRKFQKKRSLTPTGKIDLITQLTLLRQKESTAAALAPKDGAIQDTSETKKTSDSSASPSKDTSAQKAESQTKSPKPNFTTPDKAKQIQLALKKAGLYKGDIDGKIGPETKKAIKLFQKSRGLAPDGIVGLKTWEELNK